MFKCLTCEDIEAWGNKYVARHQLPELIKRLIKASIDEKNLTWIRFPSGSGTQLSGVDGVVISSIKTSKIPLGYSIWEMGSNSDYKTKATKDYTKRTKKSHGYTRKKSTFIFVTPRKWEDNKGRTSKTNWISFRKKQKKWKDVRVYDSVDIEDWLEDSPAVAIWFAKNRLNIIPQNVLSLETYWNEWCYFKEDKVEASFVLEKRESMIPIVNKWLEEPASLFKVKSISSDESISFISAVIENSSKKEDYYSRAVIINNMADMRDICASKNKLLILYSGEITSGVTYFVGQGHHIMISKPQYDMTVTPSLPIFPFSENEFIEKLKSIGISSIDAKDFYDHSNGYLSNFKEIYI